MATQKLKKNLPKRCTNERLQARRQASWKRGQERKALRRAAQERQERANRNRTGPTPWEQAKATAKARRGPVTVTEDRVRLVNRNTSYVQIRRNMDDYLGMSGITASYLDDIHRRWTRIGKSVRRGAL